MSVFTPRSNPYFSAYNFAHYDREEDKKLTVTAVSNPIEPEPSLKLPLISASGKSKDDVPSSGSRVRLPSVTFEESTTSTSQASRSQVAMTDNAAIAAAAAAAEAAIEADWDRQMKMLQEVDTLTAKGNECIPLSLKAPFIHYIEQFPGLKRVPVYKIMEEYEWSCELLSVLLVLFQSVAFETILPMVDFLNGLVPLHLDRLGLELFHKLYSQPALIHEFVVGIPVAEGHYLMQIARHLPAFELQVMADNLLSLHSVQSMLTMLHYLETHKKTAKHCALCRQKRMHTLNYHMCTDQVPGSTLTIPGLVSQYDKATVWAADDERQYSFDTMLGQIFWQKMPVNLVEICDNCLTEVHKAITNKNRHEEIHHIDASQRKEALSKLRQSEQQLSAIIHQVANERKQRRLREFGLQALSLQGKGLKREAELQEQTRAEAARLAKLAEDAEARRRLNESALAVDAKWKAIDRQHDKNFLSTRNNYALVQFHKGFNNEEARPAPMARQHSTTWRHVDFDDEGLPITAAGANQAFGTPVIEEHDDKPLLNIWKHIADTQHARYKERQRLAEEERRRQAQKHLNTLQDYIKERITVLDRQQDQMKILQEQEEIRRLEARRFDKEQRREARWQQYLAIEREHMTQEDHRAHAVRAYQEEIARETYERECMFNAECDQCEIDRFWGLEYYAQALQEEERRLRRFYHERVVQLNRELVKMGCVKAYHSPSQAKRYRQQQLLKEQKDKQVVLSNSQKLLGPALSSSGALLLQQQPHEKTSITKSQPHNKEKYRASTFGSAVAERDITFDHVDVQTLGSLPEEARFQQQQQAEDYARRVCVIKRLKAEEVRSQLKVRLPTVFC